MINYRNISFRAWDIQNERMVEYPFQFTINPEDSTKWFFYDDWRDLEDGISRSGYIMEFTGLKDKNGKDIFEGDVVEWFLEGEWGTSDLTYKGTIIWSEERCSFIVDNYGHLYSLTSIEVIGNIFQNSELLKNDKKE